MYPQYLAKQSLNDSNVREMIGDQFDQWGIWVQSLSDDSPPVTLNMDKCFPAASLIKLPVVIELYRQAIEEQLDLHTLVQIVDEYRSSGSGILFRLSNKAIMTLHDLAVLVLQLSDNTAANALIATVGRDKINQTLHQMGLHHTRLHQDRIDPFAVENCPEMMGITTPREISRLLTHLAQETILTPWACQEILTLMKRCSNKRRICGRLPLRADLTVHHKTGTLPGICHDVGIFRFTQDEYVISVLTWNGTNQPDLSAQQEMERQIARISRWVFDQYDS